MREIELYEFTISTRQRQLTEVMREIELYEFTILTRQRQLTEVMRELENNNGGRKEKDIPSNWSQVKRI